MSVELFAAVAGKKVSYSDHSGLPPPFFQLLSDLPEFLFGR